MVTRCIMQMPPTSPAANRPKQQFLLLCLLLVSVTPLLQGCDIVFVVLAADGVFSKKSSKSSSSSPPPPPNVSYSVYVANFASPTAANTEKGNLDSDANGGNPSAATWTLLGIQSYGKATARAMELHGLSRTEAGIALVKGVMPMLERVALVAHPANYIVRTSPKLTPREERRHKEKSELPVRKRPFYIVINHDRLVSLNPANAREGGHRSPVPHARRGHWMELAERCRLARAEGKTRVWLKQVYVGERQFEDEKNRYRVFVDREDLKREG